MSNIEQQPQVEPSKASEEIRKDLDDLKAKSQLDASGTFVDFFLAAKKDKIAAEVAAGKFTQEQVRDQVYKELAEEREIYGSLEARLLEAGEEKFLLDIKDVLRKGIYNRSPRAARQIQDIELKIDQAASLYELVTQYRAAIVQKEGPALLQSGIEERTPGGNKLLMDDPKPVIARLSPTPESQWSTATKKIIGRQ